MKSDTVRFWHTGEQVHAKRICVLSLPVAMQFASALVAACACFLLLVATGGARSVPDLAANACLGCDSTRAVQREGPHRPSVAAASTFDEQVAVGERQSLRTLTARTFRAQTRAVQKCRRVKSLNMIRCALQGY